MSFVNPGLSNKYLSSFTALEGFFSAVKDLIYFSTTKILMQFKKFTFLLKIKVNNVLQTFIFMESFLEACNSADQKNL